MLLFLVSIVGFFFVIDYAQAICPVCTVAVAGGLGISRWLGIDDFISAIWIGGLALSITAWGWNYLKKKNKLNGATILAVLLLVYFSILFPLYKLNYINIPKNTIFGIDKILLGAGLGTIVFWIGVFANIKLKKLNGGKVYFPLQKVVIPLLLLLFASLSYYAYCKCYNVF